MNEPLFDIGAVASSILGGCAVIVSLIWKYAPTLKNSNGHTKTVIAHEIQIDHLQKDVAEIKRDVKQIWHHLRDA